MAGTQKLGSQPSISVPLRTVKASQEEPASATVTPSVGEDSSNLTGSGRLMGVYGEVGVDVTKALSPEQNAAFQALSATDQTSFRTLYEGLSAHPEAREKLCELLNRPSVLNSKDAKGNSLLSTLGKAIGRSGVSSLERAGFSSTELVSSLLKHLDNPASVFQGDKYTCASASLQTYLAESAPAEYCRIASELWQTGEATFRNGKEIMLENPKQGDGRDPLDAMLQDAWTETAKDFDPTSAEVRGKGDWHVLTGLEAIGKALLAFKPINSIFSFLTGKKKAEGLTTNQIRQLYGSAMSAAPVVVDAASNPERNFDKLQEILKSGACTTVGLKTTEGDCHCVTVLKASRGKVTYADPATGKTTKVSTEEFKKMMSIMVVPQEFAAGYSAKSVVDTLENIGGAADPYGGRGSGGGTRR